MQKLSLPRQVILEKLPLLALAACSCVITSVAQFQGMTDLEQLPLSARAANAVVAYAVYLGQLFWPSRLAVLYPYSVENLAAWKVAAALMLLVAISVVAMAYWRRIPCLIVGWLWYLGMLTPVIGMVQVGRHATADRYTYLPQIGLCIALAWGAMAVVGKDSRRRKVVGVAATLIVLTLIGLGRRQTAFWRDSERLWCRALDCTSNNSIAHLNYGNFLAERGEPRAAVYHFQSALKIRPNYVKAHNNLGAMLLKAGKVDEATGHFSEALRLEPDNPDAHSSLSMVLAAAGRFDGAIEHCEKALAASPDRAKDHCNLGVLLSQVGRIDDAVSHLRQAVAITPDYLEAQVNLGLALERRGDADAAVVQFRRALVLAERQSKSALAASLRAKLAGGTGETAR